MGHEWFSIDGGKVVENRESRKMASEGCTWAMTGFRWREGYQRWTE